MATETLPPPLTRARPAAGFSTRLPGRWWVLLLVAAFALRLYRLDGQSLWYDEAFSVWLGQDGFRELMSRVANVDNHPPLFALLLKLGMSMWGSGEFGARFLSAAANTLAVAGFVRLGLRAGGRPVAVALGLLAAASPFYVYYGQEARGYSVALLWAVLAFDAALQCLTTDRVAVWARLALFVILSMWTHYAIGFVLVAMGGLLGIRALWRVRTAGARPALAAPLLAAALVIVAYLPWVPFALQAIARDNSFYEGSLPAVPVFITLLMGFSGWLATGGVGIPTMDFVMYGVAFVALALAGGVRLVARPSSILGGRWGVALILAAAVFPLVAYTLLQQSVPKFHPRYLMTATPALYLLAAYGVTWPAAWRSLAWQRVGRAVAAAAIAVIAFGWGNELRAYLQYAQPAKDDWRGVGAHIGQARAPGEPVLVVSGYGKIALQRYMAADGIIPVPDTPIPEIIHPVDNATLAQVDEQLEGHEHVWLVQWQPDVMDPANEFARALEAVGTEVSDIQFWGIHVREFRLNGGKLARSGATQTVAANFAEQVALDGLDQPAQAFASGEALPLRLHWRAQRVPDRNFKVAVSLIDQQRVEWGRTDLRPAGELNYTRRWAAGAAFTGDVWLPANPGTPPGRYSMELQLYDEDTLAPVPASIPGRGTSPFVPLGQVQVVARPFTPQLFSGMQPANLEGAGLKLVGYRVPPTPVAAGDEVEVRLGWEVTAPLTQPVEVKLTIGNESASAPVIAADALTLAQPGDRFLTVQRIRTAPDATGQLPLTVAVADQPAGSTTVQVQGRPINYSPLPAATALDARFGEGFELRGATLQPDRAAPGATANVRLVWHSTSDRPGRYKVFIHLLDERGDVVAQHDGEPQLNALPTTRWASGEYLEDAHPLQLPANLPAGNYTVRVGMYAWPDGARLPVNNGKDAYDLPQPITIAR